MTRLAYATPRRGLAHRSRLAIPDAKGEDHLYRVVVIVPNRMVRLVRGDNAYTVSRGASGIVRCTCPDYVFRRDGTASLCKHGREMVAHGYMGRDD